MPVAWRSHSPGCGSSSASSGSPTSPGSCRPTSAATIARGLLYSFELAHHWAVVGPLRDLVGSVVIPHFTLFGWLVFGIELSAGVLLTLGLMTRLGAVLGTAEAVAITLLVGRAPTEWFWGYAMFVVLNALPLVVPADARLSVAAARRRA